jgi:ABC-2 type transport system permease protein
MRTALRSLRAIATLAALESLRQPVALLLLSATVLLAAVLPMLSAHTLGESERMMADTQMALHLLLGMLFGGFAACHSLSGEIRRGTAATVLCKPVGRTVFFLGKFVGLAAVMLLFSTTATLVGLVSVRTVAEPYTIDLWSVGPLLFFLAFAYLLAGVVNFFARRPFVSDAFRFVAAGAVAAFLVTGFVTQGGAAQPFGAGYLWAFVPASALVALAVLALTAIALTLASRLDVVPTVSICGALVLIGMMSDYLFGRHAGTSSVAALVYAIVPNWQHFWMADALHLEETIPPEYFRAALSYAGFYLLGVLGLGIVFFRHTEVKS